MTKQFSLAALFVVTTVAAVLCAFAPFAYNAGKSINWADPWLGWCAGGFGIALAFGCVIALFRR